LEAVMGRWFFLFFVLGLAGCDAPDGGGTQGAMQEWVGTDLSQLAVQTLDGEPQPFGALAGEKKTILVNVWATWCTPCLSEMPTLDALGKSGAVKVISIATDKDAQAVKDFLKKQNWGGGMEVWHDPLGTVTRREMGALGIPVTYVLDDRLTVRLVEAGERDWNHARMPAKIF